MNKKTIKNHKKLGFSLIEAIVALGILLLGIVPIVTLANKAILFHYRAGEVEEASRISQSMIDYIKSRGYDNLETMVEHGKFSKKYTLSKVNNSDFTVDDFGNNANFNISQDMILLNSKGINLKEVNLYVSMNKVDVKLKKSDGSYSKYINPINGELTSSAYGKNFIYGKIIFGMGKVVTDSTKKTGREKELITTFIITPIENWK